MIPHISGCTHCVEGYNVKYVVKRIGKSIIKSPMRTSICRFCKGTGVEIPKFVKKVDDES